MSNNIVSKVKNFVGWEEEEDMEYEQNQNDMPHTQNFFSTAAVRKNTQDGKTMNLNAMSSKMKVIVMQPENFDDAQEICDYLKEKKPTVINLENVEKENAQRVIDFLSGAVYALEGTIQKVASGIFIVAPHNIDIMNDLDDDLKDKGGFIWNR
ncbi:MAG: cell division protein SepF [Clostridiales bacterium]|nr:cell division protein SepF [Clostridiales bacterium]